MIRLQVCRFSPSTDPILATIFAMVDGARGIVPKHQEMGNPSYICLWFDGQAKAAADFYCAIFKNSRILSEDSLVVMFELNGMKFMGLNGGPMFKFTEAVSIVVECEDQAEIDYFWERLLADGGQENQCGWLKDKYGLSWQVIPKVLPVLMADPNRRQAVMDAFMKMVKFDLQALLDA